MKIAQSNVNLVSSHHYQEERSVAVKTKVMTRGAFLESLQGQQKKTDRFELSDESFEDEAVGSDSYMSLKPSKSQDPSSTGSGLEDQIMESVTAETFGVEYPEPEKC